MIVSRLCRPAYAAFDGSGGLQRAGRWHHQGSRVVYASETEALAALEVLAHLSSFSQIPEFICVKAFIPENAVADVRDFGPLPADWASSEPLQAWALGTRWLSESASVALRVPSVIIPREANYMLNPVHPDFRRITIDSPLSFAFDVRLVTRLQ